MLNSSAFTTPASPLSSSSLINGNAADESLSLYSYDLKKAKEDFENEYDDDDEMELEHEENIDTEEELEENLEEEEEDF